MTSSSARQVFEDDKAVCAFERTSPDILLMVMSGAVTAELGDRFTAALERELQRGEPTHTFWDAYGLHAYDSRLRVDCTRLLRAQWDKVLSIHALVKSPLVRMGAAVANLALDNRVQAYAERVTWQGRLDAARESSRLRSA